jgi:hypothetical protein
MEPAPFSVHKIVPFDDVAPLTVADPLEQMVWLPPAVAVGVALTLKVTFCENALVQLGAGLVVVMPVIWRVCPLLAAVSAAEVKLAAPAALATTPATGV